jgi:predicted acylesterase/phospholipase RssA/CRP-like cAMP-binding protein
MDAASLRDWLARTALLQGAPDHVIALCAQAAERIDLAPGDTLIRAGSRSGALYLLLGGTVEVRLPGGAATTPAMAQVGEGEVLGEIQVVTGQASAADAIAAAPCRVLQLDRDLQRAIAERFASFDERLSQLAGRRLRSIVFRRTVHGLLQDAKPSLVDEFIGNATEVVLERGERLFGQGDEADAWYVLTSGRLSVIDASAEEPQKIADLMPGASVGEMALITGGQRNASVKAERKASLMRVSRSGFERFADEHPAFARRLMGTVMRRLTDQSAARRRAGTPVLVVLRASDSPRLDAALGQLGSALQRITGAAVRTRADLESAVGYRIDSSVTEAHPLWSRFDVWLEEAQREHPLVLLDAGGADDFWRRECLLHADRCLWLAEPAAEGAAGPAQVLGDALRGAREWARRDTQRLPWWLLLAHPAGTLAPRNTRAWLDGQDFDRHFHLRLDDPPSMERAARLLAGKGIGVALSGGGARGFAHIGVLKAFVERGVPIDCIGGTSIGAIQAGMFAMGLSIEAMRKLNKEVIAQRPFHEYTLPVVALVASQRRDASIRHSFGDVRIEDLWIPYLAVSTDLCAAQAVVHERGPLGLAASASSSLPGVLVPVIDGERILVDGGVVNNLPADLVKQRGGGAVFGVKAAPSDDLVAPAGGFPSGWKLAWHRLMPGLSPIPAPRLGDLLVRTMTVGSAERMAQVTRSVDVLIEPEVADFGMLQFKAIDALIERGFAAGMDALQRWQARQRKD